MYRLALICLLILSCSATSYAQDTLIFKTGKRFPVFVTDTNGYKVRYNPIALEGMRLHKKRSTSKSLLSAVRHPDGSLTAYTLHRQTGFSDTLADALNGKELYNLGMSDASIYYHGAAGASNGTLVATCPGSPALGLIVALSTSLTPPKDKNLSLPNLPFAHDPDYYRGYKRQAGRMKSGKVWTSWGIGTVATMLFVMTLNANHN